MSFKRYDACGVETPKYVQVSRILAEEIKHGYRPGDVLPSEHELAKRFNINRHTLRSAIELLVTDGIVGKLQGKGTIVQQKVIDYRIHGGTRFTETLENSGRQAESLILRKVGVPAEGEVAERLGLEEGEPAIFVETLGKMDGAPFSLASHYFSLNRVFEVMRTYNGGSLHAFLKEHYGITLKRTLSLISAVLPDHRDMQLLEINGNAPVLRVKSLNRDQRTGAPIEFVISRFKGVATQLLVEPN